jgi:carboxyl-terminal processing protease
MKRLRLSIAKNLVITFLVSLFFSLALCLGSPLLVTHANSSTEVFEQIWQTTNRYFYDPKFNGVDWGAMREKYQPLAAEAKSTEEFTIIINQMLSELGTSHTRFYPQNEPEYYQLFGIFQPISSQLRRRSLKLFPNGKIEYTGIGAYTKNINGDIFIRAILDESPAEEAGLKVGDRILSVDGNPYQSIESFAGKGGKQVKILIQRTSDFKTQQEIALTPKIFDATTMFLDAQKASRQIKKSDTCIYGLMQEINIKNSFKMT